ncbi:MAG: riboflavin kinase [Candidatus Bipolaricaulota bacterium]
MQSSVVAVGMFDGVHIGHAAVLAAARREASRRGAASVAYTFDVSPRAAIAGGPPALLLPPDARRSLLSRSADRVVEGTFAHLRLLTPHEFVEREIVNRLAASAVVVGYDFRFGHERRGVVETLRGEATSHGVDVVVVDPVYVDGLPVSSTRIRALVRAGAVEEARRLLGRPPVLLGTVVRGDGLGEQLGFPTANLDVSPAVLLPADGVYAAWAFAAPSPGATASLVYIGSRPTLEDSPQRVEAHLLRRPVTDLRNRRLEVQLLTRIRGDRPFPSLEELRRAIAADVDAVAANVDLFPPSEALWVG